MLSTPADFPFFSDCTAASTSLRRIGWSSSVCLGTNAISLQFPYPVFFCLFHLPLVQSSSTYLRKDYVVSDEGSTPEILSRIAQTTAALTRSKAVWNDRSISLSSKIRLMCCLVTSIFLYACEPWTLTGELQRGIRVMKMRCYRKILRISYKDHVTNEEACAKI